MDVVELSRQGESYEFSFNDLNTNAIANAFKVLIFTNCLPMQDFMIFCFF